MSARRGYRVNSARQEGQSGLFRFHDLDFSTLGVRASSFLIITGLSSFFSSVGVSVFPTSSPRQVEKERLLITLSPYIVNSAKPSVLRAWAHPCSLSSFLDHGLICLDKMTAQAPFFGLQGTATQSCAAGQCPVEGCAMASLGRSFSLETAVLCQCNPRRVRRWVCRSARTVPSVALMPVLVSAMGKDANPRRARAGWVGGRAAGILV